MKQNMKKWLSLILAVVMVMALAACNSADESAGDTSTPTNQPADNTDTAGAEVIEEPEEVLDLGGIEIILGDWWSAEVPDPPSNFRDEMVLEHRTMLQEKHNFTMRQVAVTDWGGMQELFTTSVMAEDPAAHIFLLAPDWTAQPLANGLLYDLSTLENLDFTQDRWNKSVLDVMTFGDSLYGMAVGLPEPKLGVYYNKRLFEEAGLDPNLPYELQANGEWTWAKFEEICQQLTIDRNNDGVIDSYAMASFSVDFFRGAVTSNSATFIGQDADGNFVNTTSDPNFLEAMQWATGMIEKGYEMPVPEDANWDWFIAAFRDSRVAMTYAEQYKVGTWAEMSDDWGFVLCPMGPKANNNYNVYFGDNIAVIPSSFDKETAEKIAFAFSLWNSPVPGLDEDEEAWKDGYYTRFRDARAVDETLDMMYTRANVITEYLPFVYGTSYGDFAWSLYALDQTPAEKIEEVAGMWNSLINDANNN